MEVDDLETEAEGVLTPAVRAVLAVRAPGSPRQQDLVESPILGSKGKADKPFNNSLTNVVHIGPNKIRKNSLTNVVHIGPNSQAQ